MAPTPNWYPDPTGRHQHRWWDGESWSDSVADQGVQASDPLTSEPGGTYGSGLEAELLAFAFAGPGVYPWQVLDGAGTVAGWVHGPRGLVIGPKVLILVDRDNRTVLHVQQSIGAGGYRAIDAVGHDLGVLRPRGISLFSKFGIDLILGGRLWGRLDTKLDELIDGVGTLLDPSGRSLAEVTLRHNARGVSWFGLRRLEPGLPVVLDALPVALYVQLRDREATQDASRATDLAVWTRRDRGSAEWPGL